MKPYLDVTLPKVRELLLNKVVSGRYFAVLLSPPCSTFSRATWANRKGPRPVRSFVFPRGFWRMTWSERKRANWGNVLADFSFKVFLAQSATAGGMALFENPEDLGAVKSGENMGIRPSSMWQWREFEIALLESGVTTAVFYQQDFGTEYLKPTRLLLKDFGALPSFFTEGVPWFDDQGYYGGPLQQRTSTKQLIGSSSGRFQTTGTEQWPSEMCRWIAETVLQRFRQLHPSTETNIVTANGGDKNKLDNIAFPTSKPEGRKLAGGLGDPRFCHTPGKSRAFHDGSGLTSMGRWDVEKRIWSQNDFWKSLRKKSLELVGKFLPQGVTLDRICFEMAVKERTDVL